MRVAFEGSRRLEWKEWVRVRWRTDAGRRLRKRRRRWKEVVGKGEREREGRKEK